MKMYTASTSAVDCTIHISEDLQVLEAVGHVPLDVLGVVLRLPCLSNVAKIKYQTGTSR